MLGVSGINRGTSSMDDAHTKDKDIDSHYGVEERKERERNRGKRNERNARREITLVKRNRVILCLKIKKYNPKF